MMKRIAVTAASLTISLVVGSVDAALAQIPSGPRELGLGGAYMGLARGFESVFLAPGNISLPGSPVWSVALVNIGIGATLYGPAFSDVFDLADFDDVSEARQQELLDLIPEDGARVDYAIRVPLVAISHGGFGFGIGYGSRGSHTLSQDLAHLLLEGYEDGRTDYAVDNTGGERAVYWDFAASYGRAVGPVSVGFTAHYLRGRTLVRTRMFEPRINLEAQAIEVDYIGALVRGGGGYSLDIGAAYMVSPEVTVSGAVTNLVGKMTWSDDIKIRSLLLDREIIDNGRPRQLLNLYKASEVDLDPGTASLQSLETASQLYDDAFAPAVARLGVAWNPRPGTYVTGDYHQTLTDGRLGEQWDRRISVGAEQAWGMFAGRLGFALGNDGGNLLGGGVSIGPLDIGLAKYQQSNVEGNRARGWLMTFGASVEQPF